MIIIINVKSSKNNSRFFMEKIKSYISIVILIACCACGKNNINKLSVVQESLAFTIENILSQGIYNDVSVGINIGTADGKRVLYKCNAEKPYITASAFKIISSAAALIKFGPEYRFETSLLTDGKIEGSILKGNLYIQGRGDPSLKLADLEKAVKKLKEKGIREISGDIVYDITYLDEERNRYAPNARNLYAPPCALTVNYNWIDVNIKEKPSLVLRLIPGTSYAKLDYEVNISKSFTPGRPLMTYRKHDWGDYYTIKGTVSAWDKKYHYVWLGVSRPGLYAATLLKETCQKAGIKISGYIKKQKVPENAAVLTKMKSAPLKKIVKVMNQESNNVIAETLNKDLGAEFLSVPGTREKGISVLKKFCVKEIGLEKDSFSIGDASGLSVNNRFSPAQFTKALNYFYKKKNIRRAFLPSLARQGHHPHAMNPIPPEDIEIFVKTGTLSVRGVNTVVGYIFLEKINEVLSFAILANRFEPGPMTYSGTLTNPLLNAVVEALKQNIN